MPQDDTIVVLYQTLNAKLDLRGPNSKAREGEGKRGQGEGEGRDERGRKGGEGMKGGGLSPTLAV